MLKQRTKEPCTIRSKLFWCGTLHRVQTLVGTEPQEKELNQSSVPGDQVPTKSECGRRSLGRALSIVCTQCRALHTPPAQFVARARRGGAPCMGRGGDQPAD